MNYEERWNILEKLLKHLINKGETIPKDVLKDLRSAKTLIQIYKMKPEDSETVRKIEKYLDNVEFQLVFAVQKIEGEKSAEEWMRKLERSRMPTMEIEEPSVSRAVYGVPRDKKWVRVKLDTDLTEEEIIEAAKEFGLEVKAKEGQWVTVFGEETDIKSFIKKIADTYSTKS